MSKLFIDRLNEKISLTSKEVEIIESLANTKKLRKRQYLIQTGDVCKSLTFVEQGALRAYSVDDRGQEHIMRFALEGWTITDFESLMSEEPSMYNIDALEDSEIVYFVKSAREEAQKLVPSFDSYVKHELTAAYSEMQKRITAMVTLSPEETYNNFIEQYPCLAQRVPQHMIASYLGLSPETLSRVRRRLLAAR